jgi:hypothetical protein
MPRAYLIHKPTHKFFGPGGNPALAVGQLRGSLLILNRFDRSGAVVEKSWAVGVCADHLTGYGHGVAAHEALSVDSMQRAWRYTFGPDVPEPAWCEIVARG